MNTSDNNIFLDDAGFNFVNKCIQTIELRGVYCIGKNLKKCARLILPYYL